jgi:hypothetical protein
MPKFSIDERKQLKNIVANLSITRLADSEIAKEIERQTGKSITTKQIYNVREQIKKDSFEWYRNLQQGKYEYIHEFKERINEILWLQQKHHEIVKNNENKPTVQQTSLNELHNLNITLSNYFDILPDVLNGSTISKPSQQQKESSSSAEQEHNQQHEQIILV